MALLTVNNSSITFNPTLLFFILVAVIVIVVADKIIKTNKKRKNKRILSTLKNGDKITLANGMLGKVISHVEETVDIELTSGARARFMDWAIIEINGEKI